MKGLLDGGRTGGPDELRSIVARAGRRRFRLAGIVGAVALAAGGGVGYGVSSATSDGSTQQIVATSPQSGTPGGQGGYTAPSVGAPAGANSSIATIGPSQYKRLFTRHVGSIDIRAFADSTPTPLPYAARGVTCFGQGARLSAEVSTPNMVAIIGGFTYGSSSAPSSEGPVLSAEPWLAGVSEADPTAFVVVNTSWNVGLVKMDFAVGGADQMTPIGGWSILAAPWPGDTVVSYGTLTAFDHAGHLLSAASVPSLMRTIPPSSGSSGSSGTGSSGAGSSGTGSPGSGSSGTASTGSGVSESPATATSPPASIASPPASVVPATVFPCQGPPRQPPPTPSPLPKCAPSTIANGATYACPALTPENTTTTTPKSGSGR